MRRVFALVVFITCFQGLAIAMGRPKGQPEEGAPRDFVVETTLDSRGVSAPVELRVPEGTRSFTVVVEGDDDRLYALASLESGGSDLVGLDPRRLSTLGGEMARLYFDEELSRMPGKLHQVLRLGTSVLTLPNQPGQPIVAGTIRLRVASDARGTGKVRVIFRATPDDGATVLRLRLVSHSRVFDPSVTSPEVTPFLGALQAEVARILEPAGLRVRFEPALRVADSPYSVLSGLSEPQEHPFSPAVAMVHDLAVRGVPNVAGALNVFLVDAMEGFSGISLGSPGPFDPSHRYFGVFASLAAGTPAVARTIAHEVCHFLGLSHVTGQGRSGVVVTDPIDDTRPGEGNLMDRGGGTRLTPGQVLVLRGSPLLGLLSLDPAHP